MSYRSRTFWDAVDAGILVLAAILALWRPPMGFLNRSYGADFYPSAQRTVTTLTNRTPFALGDVLVVVVIVLTAGIWITQLHHSPARRAWPRALLRSLALAGFLYAWFIVAWGWNYARPSLAESLGYVPDQPKHRQLDALENALVAALDRTATAAHAEHSRGTADDPALQAARARTLRAIRVDTPSVATRPKRWMFDFYFNAVGISGMFFPFTYETFVASDVLWFEFPFAIEHEWAHVAGIARESDANFVAALATLGSADPIVHYSGLLEVYAALPRGPSDRRLSKLVLDDYAAIRRRNQRRIVPLVSRVAWKTYDSYLKSQHVRTGLVNYSEYVRLLFGTDVGREALARATGLRLH